MVSTTNVRPPRIRSTSSRRSTGLTVTLTITTAPAASRRAAQAPTRFSSAPTAARAGLALSLLPRHPRRTLAQALLLHLAGRDGHEQVLEPVADLGELEHRLALGDEPAQQLGLLGVVGHGEAALVATHQPHPDLALLPRQVSQLARRPRGQQPPLLHDGHGGAHLGQLSP